MEKMHLRTHKRAKGIAPIICDGKRGRLIDISRGGVGASFSADLFKHFNVSSLYELTIKLPPNLSDAEKIELTVMTLVRNAHVDPQKRRLILGLEFCELSPEQKELLSQIIFFFAKNYLDLYRLEQRLDGLIKEDSAQILDVQETMRVLRWITENFDQLSPEIQHRIQRQANVVATRYKVLEPKSKNPA